MALLEVRGLTMRFGGLTAVQGVDFAIERGQILSVIGPNGAGKTTVFNAITGVYEPTEGTVRVDGVEIRRAFDWRVGTAAALVGLATGVGLMAFAADVDGLWRAAIVLNTGDPGTPFPVGQAFADGWAHVNAGVRAERDVNRLTDLEVREREGTWQVRSTTNKVVLESCPDEATALRRQEALASLMNLAGSARTITAAPAAWLVRGTDGAPVALHADEGAARAHVADLQALPGAAIAEGPDGWTLVADGRTLFRAAQRFECEEHQAALAWAATAVAEPLGARVVIRGPAGVLLAVHADRETARAALVDVASRAGKLRWKLVTRAASTALGMVGSLAEAGPRRELLETMLAGPPEVTAGATGDGGAILLNSDVLERFPTAAAATARADELAAIGRAASRAQLVTWLALVLGCLIGAGGTLAVWQRARRTPDLIARHGLARTFQNIRLFPDMLVVENVLIAMDVKSPGRLGPATLGLPSARATDRAALVRAHDLLRVVGLAGRADEVARNLPYGDQRRLEIARALATEPRLLLLDEPTSGMNPQETNDLTRLIRDIRDRFRLTILLIEHHMKVVMGISDRVVVLDHGAKIAEGTPAEVSRDPAVIEAYLGKTDEAIE